jgi:hypothetical protein
MFYSVKWFFEGAKVIEMDVRTFVRAAVGLQQLGLSANAAAGYWSARETLAACGRLLRHEENLVHEAHRL